MARKAERPAVSFKNASYLGNMNTLALCSCSSNSCAVKEVVVAAAATATVTATAADDAAAH
jgi:hypothetical protein